MQSIKFYICEFFLIILLSDVNGYSEVRLDDWTPTEQIKFYPRKSAKSTYTDADEERSRQAARFDAFAPYFNQLTEPDQTGRAGEYSRDPREQSDAAASPDGQLENGFKRTGNQEIENGRPAARKHFKLNKKEQAVNTLDALWANLLGDLLQQNKSQPAGTSGALENNQHLIWFLMAKIIPTTTKLNEFLCNANGSSSAEQLCTSFNHLHLLVGKSKRSSSNDETFRRARLIEDLSNQFDGLNRQSAFGKRLPATYGQVHGNLDKKFDIKLDHKFSNKFDHRKFAAAQRSFNHYDLNKRDSESLPPSFDEASPGRVDFKANFEHQKSLGNRYHLNRLMSSKSLYKHHQRLKRSVDTVLDQLASRNSTVQPHQISRRSTENEIKYPDIQQFGKQISVFF